MKNFNILVASIIAGSTISACNLTENKPKPQETQPVVQPKEVSLRMSTTEIKPRIIQALKEAKDLRAKINPDTTTINQGKELESRAKDLDSIAASYEKISEQRASIVLKCQQIRLLIKEGKIEKVLTNTSDAVTSACVEAQILTKELKDQNENVKLKAKLDAATAKQNSQTAKSVK